MKTIVCSIKSSEGSETNEWLNPMQELTTTHENLKLIRSALTDLIPEHSAAFSDGDLLVNCMTRDNVLREIIRNIADDQSNNESNC